MYKKLKNNQGFTIIEVLIVLAIAGLILLIVFLAVPALQRNARNTSRKEDASSVLAAMNEYSDNNSGTLPSAGNWTAPTMKFCTVAACGGTDAQSSAKLGYYSGYAAGANTKGELFITNYAVPPAANDSLTIYKGATCTNSTTMAAGSTNAYVALFGIEASSGFVWQCVGS